VAVNLHHLGEAIRRHFGDAFAGVPLHWSEEPEILGTLGALAPLGEFLRPADLVLLVNGDTLCPWPLGRLLRRHRRSGAEATLLLTRRADPARFGGGVAVDRAGRVVSFRADAARATDTAEAGAVERRWVFAGAHVFAPRLVAAVEARPSDIVADFYRPMLAAGRRIATLVSGRPWHDLGTPRRYLDGVVATLNGGRARRLLRRSWVAPEASVGRRVRLRDVAVEAGVEIGEGARVERAVLLPGARIGRGSVVRDAIVGFGAEIPAGSWVERRVVTPARPGFEPGPGESLLAGVVYTPFE
jgi:mannose-1-phosphate guanylyltransferase